MGSFKEKSQGFIIGIMVGLIVAGGFFILKLDDYFKELNFYKSVTNSFSNKNEKKAEPKEIKIETHPDKKKEKPAPKVSEVNTDEIVAASLSETPLTTDSIGQVMGNEDIVVRKDELLSTKTLEVMNLDPLAKVTSKDSMLQKVSGIKDDRSFKQFLNLELWSSPLNYKGYKMNKYKLVVYGITSAEGLKLFKLDDVIYLKIASFVYRLDASVDFKPYERITDEEVLSKLK